MYNNLEAEQTRCGFTDDYVADRLGITRKAYNSRKISGAFRPAEVAALVEMYDKSMDYLFGTADGKRRFGDKSILL